MRALVFFLCCCPMALVHAQWRYFESSAMTTKLELEFWQEPGFDAEALARRVFAEFDRIDRQMSRYREDSELSRINREAAHAPLPLSSELFHLLATAQRVSELSEGAFDISFASVGYLYDYRAARQPTSQQLQEAQSKVNYRAIKLDAQQQTVHLLQAGMRLDLGGIAKGYAVDKGLEVLQQAGVRHARLSAGGDMRLLGDKRGKPWIVGVRDPRAEAKQATVLPLSDTAVSTSGDYERFFIDDQGERVHHILSPQSGRPVHAVQSVTVIGPDATTTDGLSTAVFVLGVKKGLALINRLEGIDAIIIDAQRHLHYSNGLEPPKPQR